MKLPRSYPKMSDVPEDFKGAYTEEDGKAVLTGGDFEFKTESDVLAMETAKGHVKTELAEAKEKLKAFDGIDATKQKDLLDELDVLRVKVKDGVGDEDQIAIREAMRTRDREADTAKIAELEAQLGDANGFKTTTQKNGLLETSVSANIADVQKGDATFIMDKATDFIDGKLISNGTGGFDKGLEIEALMAQATSTRPHWAKQNAPSHGDGSDGSNVQGADLTRYNELKTKVDAGDASRKETNEFIQVAETVANEAKQGD
jgi:hypothetical protein